MTKLIVSFVAGLIFGFGLLVSGMSNPAKVLNFLDIFGTFDPSLLFVMGGAIVTVFFGYKFILKREKPLMAEQFHIPTRKDIDHRLIVGSALFGIGWGIGGFCPGPALTSLLMGSEGILYFLPSMIIGLAVARKLNSLKQN